MKAKGLRWIFAAVLVAILVVDDMYGLPAIGASAESTNGHYRFVGGTTPGAIALALLVIGLYVALMYSSPPSIGQPVPGVFRRFVAFWCDFMFAMISIVPIVGILPTLIEWKRTGAFAWNFTRTTSVPGDTFQAVIGLLCGGGALILYFALPLMRRRPSPGSCILGYQILACEGTTMSLRTAVLRTLLGFIAVCAAYVAPFVARDPKTDNFGSTGFLVLAQSA